VTPIYDFRNANAFALSVVWNYNREKYASVKNKDILLSSHKMGATDLSDVQQL
jgi:hypothetical protein